MTWVNQPRHWSREGSDLEVHTEGASDFWRTTALGYDRDSGHAFLAREQGDLTIEATVSADYAEQHDEAGLMLRVNERTWVKAAVRLVEGALVAAVVSTRDVSDLSVAPLPVPAGTPAVRIRLERHGNAVRVLYASPEEPFSLLRLTFFPAGIPIGVGPMCCSPRRAGLAARFTGCTIESGRPTWAWLT